MSKQIFPKEFIHSSLEHYTFKIRGKSYAIYLIVTFSFAVLISILPFISVDVFVQATGMINTQEKRHIITSPVSGLIKNSYLSENRYVKKGDLLLEYDPSNIQKELRNINMRLIDCKNYIYDLKKLISNTDLIRDDLITNRYYLNYLTFKSAFNKLLLERDNQKKAFKRQKQLFAESVIAAVDFEQSLVSYERTEAEIVLYKNQSINSWEESALLFEDELNELNFRRSRVEAELEKYSIQAPMHGELQNVYPLRPGQYISSGIEIAQLSPDTTLIATCLVSPKDIGILTVGMNAAFRIHAFDSNNWGFLTGKINSISSDVYLIDNRPAFKVECELDQNFLSLKSGFVGYLKKGMTFHASFKVTNRTLFQLLHDKVSDWFNPNLSHANIIKLQP